VTLDESKELLILDNDGVFGYILRVEKNLTIMEE
jgi:hypothetical protein